MWLWRRIALNMVVPASNAAIMSDRPRAASASPPAPSRMKPQSPPVPPPALQHLRPLSLPPRTTTDTHRPSAICDSWESPELTSTRYHFTCRVHDYDWWLSDEDRERDGGRSVETIEDRIEGNRLTIESLDFRLVLSVYFNAYRVTSAPLAKSKTKKKNQYTKNSPTQKESAEPVTVEYIDSSDPTAPPLTVVTLHSSLPPCRLLVSNYSSNEDFDKFLSIVNQVSTTPRSDLWLDVPDAARLQAQLRGHAQQMEEQLENKKQQLLQVKGSEKLQILIKKEDAQPVTDRQYLKTGTSPMNGHSDKPSHSKSKSVSASLSVGQRLDSENTRTSSHSASAHSSPNYPTKRSPSPSLSLRPPTSSSTTRGSQLAGFKNVGNSCYMNAILQSLLSVQSFVDDLTELSLSFHSDSFTGALLNIVSEMNRNDHGVIDVAPIKSTMASRTQRFANDLQQDAHEFLSECLNHLNEDFSNSHTDTDTDTHPHATNGGDGSTDSQRRSPVDRNFHTEIEFTLRCTNPQCNYTRNNYEAFHDLSLDISDSNDLSANGSSRQSSPMPLTSASPSPEPSPTFSPMIGMTNGGDSMPPLLLTPTVDSGVTVTHVSANSELHSSSPSPPPAADSSSSLLLKAKPRPNRNKRLPITDLTSMLNKFFADRIIDCKCSECDNNQVTMTAKIRQLPRVLILHLKRFLPNFAKGTYEKCANRIDIQQMLDLKFACNQQTLQPPVIASMGAKSGDRYNEKITDDGCDSAHLNGVIQSNFIDHSSSSISRASKRKIEDASAAAHLESQTPLQSHSNGSALNDRKRLKSVEFTELIADMVVDAPLASPTPAPTPTPIIAPIPVKPGSGDVRVTRAMQRQKHESQKKPQPAVGNAANCKLKEAASAPLFQPSPIPMPLLHANTVEPAVSDSVPIEDTAQNPPAPEGDTATSCYRLLSIVHHRGPVAYSGHYLTDIRESGDASVWTRYDDQFVKQVTHEQAMRQGETEGYILFFQQEQPARAS